MHYLFDLGVSAAAVCHAYLQLIELEVARHYEVGARAREVADYQEALVAVTSAVADHLPVVRIVLYRVAVDQRLFGFSEREQPLVEAVDGFARVESRIHRVGHRLAALVQIELHVDLFVLRIHALPRLCAGIEARVLCGVPLHRCSGVVPDGAPHHFEGHARRYVKIFRHVEDEVRHRVLHLIRAPEGRVCHADLFALIDERCAPAQECYHRQECGRLVSVLLCVDAESADAPRLVMVLEHQGVPAAAVVSQLRVYEAALELPEAERLRYHLEAEHVV